MLAKYKELIIVLIILALAAVIRFWGLPALELHNDGAHYAFRALGWFDYLGGTEQTTPIQWFGSVPAWANLSFHDAPPLAFALQKIAFWLFSGSVFSALLPGTLAGLGALLLLYFAAKAAFGNPWAYFATGLYAVSSYAVWSGRAGYLEAVEVVFLIGSFYFFYRYWQTSRPKYGYLWGVFTGLALLTKYTALFLLPAAAVFILWKMRGRLKRPDFWLAVFLMLVVLSPVIVYNINVFSTRGHFDAALSSMVGMKPEDFKLIAGRADGSNWWQNVSGVLSVLSGNISQPLFWMSLASLVWLLAAVVLRRAREFSLFLFLNIGFAWIMFGFTGSADRYLSVLVPFLVLSLVGAVFDLWAAVPQAAWRRAFAVVLALAVAFELVYSVQTNLLIKPFWPWPYAYAGSRFYDRGFAELDKYLVRELGTDQQSFQRPKTMQELSRLTLRGSELVFFDTRADWFSTMWHVSRLRFYYGAPIVNFRAAWKTADGAVIDSYRQFQLAGLSEMLLVVAVNDNRVYSGGEEYDKAMDAFVARISAAGIAPTKTILDYQGRPGFEIYRLTPISLK